MRFHQRTWGLAVLQNWMCIWRRNPVSRYSCVVEKFTFMSCVAFRRHYSSDSVNRFDNQDMREPRRSTYPDKSLSLVRDNAQWFRNSGFLQQGIDPFVLNANSAHKFNVDSSYRKTESELRVVSETLQSWHRWELILWAVSPLMIATELRSEPIKSTAVYRAHNINNSQNQNQTFYPTWKK